MQTTVKLIKTSVKWHLSYLFRGLCNTVHNDSKFLEINIISISLEMMQERIYRCRCILIRPCLSFFFHQPLLHLLLKVCNIRLLTQKGREKFKSLKVVFFGYILMRHSSQNLQNIDV